jgi:hypothetical protein
VNHLDPRPRQRDSLADANPPDEETARLGGWPRLDPACATTTRLRHASCFSKRRALLLLASGDFPDPQPGFLRFVHQCAFVVSGFVAVLDRIHLLISERGTWSTSVPQRLKPLGLAAVTAPFGRSRSLRAGSKTKVGPFTNRRVGACSMAAEKQVPPVGRNDKTLGNGMTRVGNRGWKSE